MNVVFAAIADAANVSQDGKLNILGMFSHIASANFPATHTRMVLVMKLGCTSAEFGVARPLRIVVLDADGKDICQVNGSVTPPRLSQLQSEMDVIVPFDGIVFPSAGSYRIDILIGDDHKHSVHLGLHQIAPNPPL